MTISSLYSLLRTLLLIAAAINAKSPSTSSELQTDAAFARIKSLAGDWQSIGTKGERSRISIQVISGGSAVMERFSSDMLPPNAGEMVTIYYIDRGDLVLTHYCIAHNQPHLRATHYDANSGELDFDFVDGGNISSGNEGHMHSMKLHFIDDQHYTGEWEFMQDKSPKFTEVSEFTRVK
jgi:hypothetical protein